MESYRFDGLLGRGGMAEVYRAWHTGLHRWEAVKLLLPPMLRESSGSGRFCSLPKRQPVR